MLKKEKNLQSLICAQICHYHVTFKHVTFYLMEFNVCVGDLCWGNIILCLNGEYLHSEENLVNQS